MSIHALARIGLAGCLAFACALVSAQQYPAKPVRILTPFPGGSGPDAVLRVVGEKLPLLLSRVKAKSSVLLFLTSNTPLCHAVVGGAEIACPRFTSYSSNQWIE